ncbi:LPS-assembly protein LptD [Sphingobium boeckii]|uniref:LPS-assembly protein LptD n=1 Tax=Sphingobium boeckii TaxID=1082345 RepID=A0A7W9EFL0_9SPHN|nr:LPS assembly protein LptD [Sphingobium boeckii]MBB5687362.1 LPS-assembly protein [Sphingobium boeckii]
MRAAQGHAGLQDQVTLKNRFLWTALPFVLPVALLAASPGQAQDLQTPATDLPAAPNAALTPATDEEITFSASGLEYDSNNEIVTASGDVRMFREGNRLAADTVIWNRKTGEVRAEGNVAIVNPGGDTAYGDSVILTDTLRDGVVDNLLVVLDDGSRLAAVKGTRSGDLFTLERAAYSPCSVVDSKGCPKDPTWKITAVRVTYDSLQKRVKYKGARIELFGIPFIPLPGLAHPTGGEAGSGLMMPDIRYDRVNGFELALPYYWRIEPDRDLTITPHVYTESLPMIEAQFRALADQGALQVTAYGTHGKRQPISSLVPGNDEEGFRGYFDASGRFQLDPYWSVTGSARVVSDRTFLRRYDISRDDRLRTTVNMERVGVDSYFSLAGWATQTLRANTVQGQQPIALPVIDYRRRMNDGLLGGKIELQANSLFLSRTAGQDTQRVFASARWDLRRLTPWGQEVTFTAYARQDAYHTDEILSTLTPSYRGSAGWSGRTVASLAADMRWPFVGEAFGGTQRFTPRFQVVASPVDGNMRVPNEDSRAVELEDSNIFALNRFPGYDRYEDGARATYGFEWGLDRPGLSIQSVIGQSYRLSSEPALFPDGTGLSNRTSDVVGRTVVKFRRLVSLTHRYRLDKDSLAIRRNEIDATVGTEKTYVTAAYLRLNRNITAQLEDLRDREEIRLGGRLQFAKYWSIFGSTTIDLTGAREDLLTDADGFEPARHRLGIAYDDECLEFGLTWRRDYEDRGDAKRGNSFLLRVAFKQLGR